MSTTTINCATPDCPRAAEPGSDYCEYCGERRAAYTKAAQDTGLVPRSLSRRETVNRAADLRLSGAFHDGPVLVLSDKAPEYGTLNAAWETDNAEPDYHPERALSLLGLAALAILGGVGLFLGHLALGWMVRLPLAWKLGSLGAVAVGAAVLAVWGMRRVGR